MKGFVPTPEIVVDLMVEKLFRDRPPNAGSRLLDPGCGNGAFIDGVIRWCERQGLEMPHIVGVECHHENFPDEEWFYPSTSAIPHACPFRLS